MLTLTQIKSSLMIKSLKTTIQSNLKYYWLWKLYIWIFISLILDISYLSILCSIYVQSIVFLSWGACYLMILGRFQNIKHSKKQEKQNQIANPIPTHKVINKIIANLYKKLEAMKRQKNSELVVSCNYIKSHDIIAKA